MQNWYHFYKSKVLLDWFKTITEIKFMNKSFIVENLILILEFLSEYIIKSICAYLHLCILRFKLY